MISASVHSSLCSVGQLTGTQYLHSVTCNIGVAGSRCPPHSFVPVSARDISPRQLWSYIMMYQLWACFVISDTPYQHSHTFALMLLDDNKIEIHYVLNRSENS